MDNTLTDDLIETIKSAAARLTGFQRRAYLAEIALKYGDGSARKAESVFGWGRDAICTRLGEKRTGICWWDERGPQYGGVKRLQIELDSGPEINSPRTQLMKRLVAFADRTRGVRLTSAAFRPIAKRLVRSSQLPKWSIVIQPQ